MTENFAQQIDLELRMLSDHSTPSVRILRRAWSRKLRDVTPESVLATALDLFERYGHRWVAYELVLFHRRALRLVDAPTVERFAGHLASWGDVDQFGILLAGPAWRAGQIDDSIIMSWAQRDDRWWRRAALVATVPLNSAKAGDAPRTLTVCSFLLNDRDDMVIKALSWALRALIAHDRSAVTAFLAQHHAMLPARVNREVIAKLTTGLKNPRRGRSS